jgi:hypothetical protein
LCGACAKQRDRQGHRACHHMNVHRTSPYYAYPTQPPARLIHP